MGKSFENVYRITNGHITDTEENWEELNIHTAQKMKFSIKDLCSKCHQILMKLSIWSHLLKKSILENFIFLWSVIRDLSKLHL